LFFLATEKFHARILKTTQSAAPVSLTSENIYFSASRRVGIYIICKLFLLLGTRLLRVIAAAVPRYQQLWQQNIACAPPLFFTVHLILLRPEVLILVVWMLITLPAAARLLISN